MAWIELDANPSNFQFLDALLRQFDHECARGGNHGEYLSIDLKRRRTETLLALRPQSDPFLALECEYN